MRRTIISAVIGIMCAVVAMFVIDTYRAIQSTSRFAEAQQQAPSEWLLVENFDAPDVQYPQEPEINFVGTPSRDLLIRLAVSSRNADTGNVLCSGGGATVLYEGGVPVSVDSQVSNLAGLDSCSWPVGRYSVRLTFLMTEPESQVAKTLLVETDDIEVLAAP